MFVDVLPKWERYTYWIVGLSSIAYSLYILHLEGEKNKDILFRAAWQPGWTWIGRSQDLSDDEWWIWRKAIFTLIPLNIIHVLLSHACFYFRCKPKLRSSLLLLFDMGAISYMLGVRAVILFLSEALLVYATSFIGSVLVVWIATLGMIASLNYSWVLNLQAKYLGVAGGSEAESMYLVAAAFFHLHLISFAIEKVGFRKAQYSKMREDIRTAQDSDSERLVTAGIYENSKNKIQEQRYSEYTAQQANHHPLLLNKNGQLESSTVDCDPSLSDMIFYSFYLPTFFDGPTFLYRDFHVQVRASFSSSVYAVDVWDIAKQLVRLTLWAFFIEFQLHFLYFTALSLHKPVVQRMSMWAVAAMGYYQGQFFMVKYLCMYGISIQISRFDGVVPLPVPRCISWVYSYTDMWKYFDVGLYKFIKEYIFIPCGGSRAGFIRKIAASGLAFLFIYFWHGAQYKLLVWCMGNYIMGVLEATVLQLECSSIGIKLKSQISPAVQLRLRALFIAPAYLISCFQIFYFFFDTEVAWTIIERLIIKAPWSSILAWYLLVTVNIHNALYISQRYAHAKSQND